jgi:outer membrane protein
MTLSRRESPRAAAAACLALGLLAGAPSFAQQHVLKAGPIRYTTSSVTDGVHGVGVPAGADVETGDATTLLMTYEYLARPDLGIELALGIPPRLHARATGSVAFLGEDVLSAKIIAPTLFANYHFGAPGQVLRPYVGAGVNYTRFVSIRSKLADDVEMSDSLGWALQLGADWAITPSLGVFASVAKLRVKSDVVASGVTVLTTSVNFRPVTWQAGMSWRF